MESFAKEYIIQALFILMKNKEFSKISVTDICDKAGVSRLSFYRIFQTKENVILSFFRMKESQFVMKNECLRFDNNIKNTISAVFYGLYENKEQFDILLKNHLENTYLEYLNESFTKGFREMKYEVSEVTPYIYAGMLYNSTLNWAKNGYQIPPDQMAESICSVIFPKAK